MTGRSAYGIRYRSEGPSNAPNHAKQMHVILGNPMNGKIRRKSKDRWKHSEILGN